MRSLLPSRSISEFGGRADTLYDRVSVHILALNMGTSVDVIVKHYGHVKPLQAHNKLTARYKIKRPVVAASW